MLPEGEPSRTNCGRSSAQSYDVLAFAAVRNTLDGTPCDAVLFRDGLIGQPLSFESPHLPDLAVGDLAMHVFLATSLGVVVLPSVLHLVGLARPLAVLGAVVSVVIDPIQFVAARSIAHILDEVPKLAPSVAHRNTPGSVVTKRGVIGVVAPSTHIGKGAVERVTLLIHP